MQETVELRLFFSLSLSVAFNRELRHSVRPLYREGDPQVTKEGFSATRISFSFSEFCQNNTTGKITIKL